MYLFDLEIMDCYETTETPELSKVTEKGGSSLSLNPGLKISGSTSLNKE